MESDYRYGFPGFGSPGHEGDPGERGLTMYWTDKSLDEIKESIRNPEKSDYFIIENTRCDYKLGDMIVDGNMDVYVITVLEYAKTISDDTNVELTKIGSWDFSNVGNRLFVQNGLASRRVLESLDEGYSLTIYSNSATEYALLSAGANTVKVVYDGQSGNFEIGSETVDTIIDGIYSFDFEAYCQDVFNSLTVQSQDGKFTAFFGNSNYSESPLIMLTACISGMDGEFVVKDYGDVLSQSVLEKVESYRIYINDPDNGLSIRTKYVAAQHTGENLYFITKNLKNVSVVDESETIGGQVKAGEPYSITFGAKNELFSISRWRVIMGGFDITDDPTILEKTESESGEITVRILEVTGNMLVDAEASLTTFSCVASLRGVILDPFVNTIAGGTDLTITATVSDQETQYMTELTVMDANTMSQLSKALVTKDTATQWTVFIPDVAENIYINAAAGTFGSWNVVSNLRNATLSNTDTVLEQRDAELGWYGDIVADPDYTIYSYSVSHNGKVVASSQSSKEFVDTVPVSVVPYAGDISITARAIPAYYTLTTDIDPDKVEVTATSSELKYGDEITFNWRPLVSGDQISQVVIEMADINGKYSVIYRNTNRHLSGTFKVNDITGNIRVMVASGEKERHRITLSSADGIENWTNTISSVSDGENYDNSFVLKPKYTVKSVRITMGEYEIVGGYNPIGNAISIDNITDDVTITVATEYMKDTYSITYSLDEGIDGISNTATEITEGDGYAAKLSVKPTHTLTGVTVTQNGAAIDAYDSETEIVSIPVVNGNITITATTREIPAPVYYDVTVNGDGGLVPVSATTVIEGGKVEIPLSAIDGYDIVSALVSMGGTTDSNWFVNGNTISIPAVTGDVNAVITTERKTATLYSAIADYDNEQVAITGLDLKYEENSSLACDINAKPGYDIRKVTVTMGDMVRTFEHDCIVEIMNVTNDVRITVESEIHVEQTYKVKVNYDTNAITVDGVVPYYTRNSSAYVRITPEPFAIIDGIDVSEDDYDLSADGDSSVLIIRNITEDVSVSVYTSVSYVVVLVYDSSVVSLTNLATKVNSGEQYGNIINVPAGYELSNVNVIMGGRDITSTALHGNLVKIQSADGPIEIDVEVVRNSYPVVLNLANCISMREIPAYVEHGTSIETSFHPDNGYTIDTLTASVGGKTVATNNGSIGDLEFVLNDITGNVEISVSARPLLHGATMNLGSGVSLSEGTTEGIEHGSSVTYRFSLTDPETYGFKTSAVSIRYADGTTSSPMVEKDGNTLSLTVANVSQDMEITVPSESVRTKKSYSVNYIAGGHIQFDSKPTVVLENDPLSITVSADQYYAISEMSITMGGKSFTSSVYTRSTGKIYIKAVTGAVEISCSAIQTPISLVEIKATGCEKNGNSVILHDVDGSTSAELVFNADVEAYFDGMSLTVGENCEGTAIESYSGKSVFVGVRCATDDDILNGIFTFTISPSNVLTFTVYNKNYKEAKSLDFSIKPYGNSQMDIMKFSSSKYGVPCDSILLVTTLSAGETNFDQGLLSVSSQVSITDELNNPVRFEKHEVIAYSPTGKTSIDDNIGIEMFGGKSFSGINLGILDNSSSVLIPAAAFSQTESNKPKLLTLIELKTVTDAVLTYRPTVTIEDKSVSMDTVKVRILQWSLQCLSEFDKATGINVGYDGVAKTSKGYDTNELCNTVRHPLFDNSNLKNISIKSGSGIYSRIYQKYNGSYYSQIAKKDKSSHITYSDDALLKVAYNLPANMSDNVVRNRGKAYEVKNLNYAQNNVKCPAWLSLNFSVNTVDPTFKNTNYAITAPTGSKFIPPYMTVADPSLFCAELSVHGVYEESIQPASGMLFVGDMSGKLKDGKVILVAVADTEDIQQIDSDWLADRFRYSTGTVALTQSSTDGVLCASIGGTTPCVHVYGADDTVTVPEAGKKYVAVTMSGDGKTVDCVMSPVTLKSSGTSLDLTAKETLNIAKDVVSSSVPTNGTLETETTKYSIYDAKIVKPDEVQGKLEDIKNGGVKVPYSIYFDVEPRTVVPSSGSGYTVLANLLSMPTVCGFNDRVFVSDKSLDNITGTHVYAIPNDTDFVEPRKGGEISTNFTTVELLNPKNSLFSPDPLVPKDAGTITSPGTGAGGTGITVPFVPEETISPDRRPDPDIKTARYMTATNGAAAPELQKKL